MQGAPIAGKHKGRAYKAANFVGSHASSRLEAPAYGYGYAGGGASGPVAAAGVSPLALAEQFGGRREGAAPPVAMPMSVARPVAKVANAQSENLKRLRSSDSLDSKDLSQNRPHAEAKKATEANADRSVDKSPTDGDQEKTDELSKQTNLK